jgi:CBS domain containing-hemolysin-like protein
MSVALPLLCYAAIVFLSAICSGAEIGMYSLSRPRLEAECAQGHRTARVMRSLVRTPAWMLATLLVWNNFSHQASSLVGAWMLAPLAIAPSVQELAITAVVTPPMLLLGELFPKDLFRRKPHTLFGLIAPLLYVMRSLVAVLAFPLQILSSLLSRLFGADQSELTRVQGREAVIELLRERESELSPQVEKLARNVLDLRSRRVGRVMVPWKKVETVSVDLGLPELRRRASQSSFARHPVVDAGGAVKGYVHQLEVLAAGPGVALAGLLRPLLALDPDTPLDRALARLRSSGQRAALVGTPARPLGWVTLKDLVEEISGELVRW